MFWRLAVLLVLTTVASWPAAAFAEDGGSSQSDKSLEKIQHIVVVYDENHSFDNLYGGWEGVNGVTAAAPRRTIQVGQGGAPYACLLQDDVNLSSPPQPVTCTDNSTSPPISSHFPNAPFTIDQFIPTTATTCPPPGAPAPNGVANGSGLPGGCTRDIVHRFYQEQYQLNGGAQNRYVTGSDAVGLTMGVYNTRALPIYAYLHQDGHPDYAIADNFFQGAFGGSFLNHQWLVAAQDPVWRNALNDGSANDLHSVVDSSGMPTSYPLYKSPAGATVKDLPLTASCSPGAGRGPTPPGVVCGDFAVNTIQPFYQPYSPGTALAKRLPPQTAPTIGSRLSAKGVDWAWYAGGWSNANGDVNAPGWTNRNMAGMCSDPNVLTGAVWPNCPDKLFQFHHQPFNYYAAYAPGTEARSQHLRDEAEFTSLAQSSKSKCGLKPVSFVKPIGEDNEHPGYASEAAGDTHLVNLLKTIEGGSCARDTMVVVTYDEFGGQWDHVSPPGQAGKPGSHDVNGPGTRVPAVILARHLRGDFVVDSSSHDTTSILATIEHRFGLQALSSRDATVNDLATVFGAKPPDDGEKHGSG
jgi:acid phosphatase